LNESFVVEDEMTMTANLPNLSGEGGAGLPADDSTWWAQNRDAVEAQFIGMLIAETNRTPYTGPERRSRATVVLDPADLSLALGQASRMGIPYEEHVRRLFHQAVEAAGQQGLRGVAAEDKS
jgi:hypothetical protein